MFDCYGEVNMGRLISRHARCRPHHTAVVCGGERLTYLEFNDRVNAFSNALLACGLRKGDKVATVLPNCLELLVLYWAAAKTGIAAVPLSPLLKAPALARLLDGAGAAMVIGAPSQAELLAAVRIEDPGIRTERYLITGEAPEGFCAYDRFIEGASRTEPPDAGIKGGDLFNIIYSSGTTGEPKGIIHTHFIRAMYAMVFGAAWRMTPESVVLQTGALIFNGAFVTMLPCFFYGATYVLHEAFEEERLIETIAEENVTHVMMVPAQIIAVMNSAKFTIEKLATLEMILTLGSPLHLEHKQRLEAALPGRFHELYGLTEGFMTILDRADFATKPGSVGVPPPFFEMRIVGDDGRDCNGGEVGEIVGRGPMVMPGYYKRDDLTAQTIRDGWLFTGDLGYVDEDGFLYLVDRKKDMIISGGINVYPRDIEEVIVMHPSVRETAVFGIQHDKWGETPVAAVILADGQTVSASELRDWINENVGAKFQKVHDVLVLEEFPRSAAGKTLKRELRETYSRT